MALQYHLPAMEDSKMEASLRSDQGEVEVSQTRVDQWTMRMYFFAQNVHSLKIDYGAIVGKGIGYLYPTSHP